MKYHFRCRSNPKGPLLTLDTKWEADEMRAHPDYDPVDADGLPIVVEDEGEVKKGDQILFNPLVEGAGK